MPIRTKAPNVQNKAVYPLSPSTLEDVDYALYEFINDELNIYSETNRGFKKVPVMYSVPERAYQIKNDPNLRPNGRTLLYPLISILKTSINQDPAKKGRYGVHIPPYFDYYNRGGSIDIARVIHQDKTKNFANANSIRKSQGQVSNYQTFPMENKNIVYETLSVPMPSFVEVSYTISIVTEYQQQMNDILAAFASKTSTPSAFKITHNKNEYEAFITPEYSLENNSSGLETSERIFRTTITINVLGYLIGATKNQETPNVVRRQSAAKVQIQRERVVLGDEIDYHVGRKDKYRP
tara:strand:- start:742 stop:1623 length:882 start_codon:yes stop_codon:yes gene_type:complete